MSRRLLAALSLAVLSFLTPRSAAAQVNVDRLERTIAVSVVTEPGEILKGVGPGHFRASVNHHPIQILSAEESTSHRVVLLFDTSSSMMGQNHLPSLVFASVFVTEMTPGASFALMTFASRIEHRTELSLDRSVLLAELKKLNSAAWDANRPQDQGRTAVLDTIGLAIRALDPPKPGDAILVVSDGGDNASHLSWARTCSLLARSRVRLFALVPVPVLASLTPEEQQGPRSLRELSQRSGGDFFSYTDEFDWLTESWLAKHRTQGTEKVEPLVACARMFAQEAGNFYLLKIRLPEPVEKPRAWKLEVVDPQTGKPDHRLRVLYPKELVPLPAGSGN